MKNSLGTLWFIAALLCGGVIGYMAESLPVGTAVFGVLLVPLIIGVYIPYAKKNPKHFWFKRKLYGWGWTPVTWQGWMVTLFYVGLVALLAARLEDSTPFEEAALTFGLPVALLTGAFIFIAYKTGEKPRWQWGDRSGE